MFDQYTNILMLAKCHIQLPNVTFDGVKIFSFCCSASFPLFQTTFSYLRDSLRSFILQIKHMDFHMFIHYLQTVIHYLYITQDCSIEYPIARLVKLICLLQSPLATSLLQIKIFLQIFCFHRPSYSSLLLDDLYHL